MDEDKLKDASGCFAVLFMGIILAAMLVGLIGLIKAVF